MDAEDLEERVAIMMYLGGLEETEAQKAALERAMAKEGRSQ